MIQFPKCDKLVEYFGCGFRVIGGITTGVADLLDDGKWNKKAILYVTLYITIWSLRWAFEYTISQSGSPGIDTAAVIGAVMLPISGLQAAVVKFYLDESTRSKQIDSGQPTIPGAP